jgi:hypothetical protein
MPYDDPDPQDPSVRFGIELNVTLEDMRDMAYAMAEEYARMGQSSEDIAALFRSAEYGGAHLAWRALGEAEIERIAGECAALFGRSRLEVIDAPEFFPPSAPGRLPMVR